MFHVSFLAKRRRANAHFQTAHARAGEIVQYTTEALVFLVICNHALPPIPAQTILIVDDVVVVIPLLLSSPAGTYSCSGTSRSKISLTSGFLAVLLGYSIAGIDPIGIYVNGSREIYGRRSISGCCALRLWGKGVLTINGALELLVADLAGELSHPGFLIELDGHGLLVVAEKTGECRSQGLVLQGVG
jgi:hypothetical protein